MSLDAYRQNWRAINDRKAAIDEHLAQFRKTAKPMINVDAVVFVVVLLCVVALGFYLLGVDDGPQLCSPFPTPPTTPAKLI